jgi:uncharacterized delta-60 repeat protein
MKTPVVRGGGLFLVGALASVVALAAGGCSDDDTVAAVETDSGVADAGASPDTSTSQDGGQDVQAADANEAGPVGPQPVILDLVPGGHDRLFGVTYDAAGNLYATGVASATATATSDLAFIVAKLTPAGVLDTSFGTNGVATLNVVASGAGEVARGIVLQSTGKIVVAGTVEHAGATDARDRDIAVVRFNANGTPDTTFGAGGTSAVRILDLSDGAVAGSGYSADSQWGLLVRPNDKLVITGAIKASGRTDTDYALVQLDADGTTDTTGFGTSGVFSLDLGDQQSASARNATLLADGSVVMVGYKSDAANVGSPVMFKVTPAGVLDTTFATGGVYNELLLPLQSEFYAASQQGTSFVTAGYGRSNASESLDWLSVRINAAGQRDMTYGTSGLARMDLAGQTDNARFVVTLPDQRVMVMGSGRVNATDANAMVAVFTKDGQPDTTFGPQGRRVFDLGGPADFFWAAAVSPDAKKVALVGLAAFAADAGVDDKSALLVLSLP